MFSGCESFSLIYLLMKDVFRTIRINNTLSVIFFIIYEGYFSFLLHVKNLRVYIILVVNKIKLKLALPEP